MRIAVLKERAAGESRVAATPETVKKFGALGATLAVEAGAGEGASISDAAYAEAGAEVRILDDFWPLADAVAASSLQFSILRKRNAKPRRSGA